MDNNTHGGKGSVMSEKEKEVRERSSEGEADAPSGPMGTESPETGDSGPMGSDSNTGTNEEAASHDKADEDKD